MFVYLLIMSTWYSEYTTRYPQIMPQSNKAKNVFDNGKNSSYDIKSIVACQQSNKNSATFKLVVLRDAERNKRYEFEAESAQIASMYPSYRLL